MKQHFNTEEEQKAPLGLPNEPIPVNEEEEDFTFRSPNITPTNLQAPHHKRAKGEGTASFEKLKDPSRSST